MDFLKKRLQLIKNGWGKGDTVMASIIIGLILIGIFII